MERDKILAELRSLHGPILDFEGELKPLRDKRDALVIEGLRIGIPERILVASSGISRGWISTLKTRAGVPKSKARVRGQRNSRANRAKKAS